MQTRFLTISICILVVGLVAAEARRGFSSGSSGSGAYDSDASTTSWDLSSTPDADCQAEFGQSCADLTTAQLEEVTQKTNTAKAAGYANYSDYETASNLGYAQTSDDGATWTSAKGANAGLEADCNAVSGGDCDAITKSSFITTSDGRTDAISAGYDGYNDWLTAQGKGYSQNASDAAMWAEAKGNTLQMACQAELPSATNCNELTKALYAQAQSGNALMAAKIAKVQAGTLTNADLTDLGLDLSTNSTLGSNPSAWQLDYLETVLETATGTAKSSWQSTIDAYSTATASAWYISQIAQSSGTAGTYAASNATYDLFHNANVDSGLSTPALACATGGTVTSGKACGALGITNAQIAANIRSSGFTSPPGATAMRDFLTEARGFASGTSYAEVASAISNGWSLANYLTAIGNDGWSNSAADKTAFANCLSNSDTVSGGAGTCSLSKAAWGSINAIVSAGSISAITGSQLQSAISVASITASGGAFGSLSSLTDFETDYIKACMGSTTTINQLNTCVTNATTSKLTTQKISGMITNDYSGTPTLADFENAGLASVDSATGDQNVITFLKKSVCGTDGTTGCSAALASAYTDSALVSAKGSGSDTQTALVNYLKDALLEYNKSVIDNTPAPAAQNGTSCGTITLNVPAVCAANPAFSCTAQSGWTMADNQQTMTKNWGSTTGTVSATVTITRNAWWGGSSYSRNVSSSTTLAEGGTVSYTFTDAGGNHPGFASALDACFDAGGKIVAKNNKSSVTGWGSSYYIMPNGSTDRDRNWWNSLSQGTEIGPLCNAGWCDTSNQCAGPAASSHYQSLYNINRFVAFSCASLDYDHNGAFICKKSACSN